MSAFDSYLFDASKPPEGPGSPPVSADLRNNFNGLRGGLWGRNLVRDSGGRIWAAGVSAAPTHYSVQGGAGSAIARETTIVYPGTKEMCSFKVTGASAASEYLQQQILTTNSFLAMLRGQYVAFGCLVYCETGSAARIGIFDGNGDPTWSEFAAAGSDFYDEDDWSWLVVAKKLDATASDRIVIRMQTAQGIVAYFQGPTLMLGSVPPLCPIPSIAAIGVWGPGTQRGEIEVVTTVNDWNLPLLLPGIVINTTMIAGTAGATTAIIYDVNKGGSSMYSTRPQLAAGSTGPSDNVPDGDYDKRCFARNDVLTFDCDQIGTGTVGENVQAFSEVLHYPHPFQPWLGSAGLTEVGG